MTTALWIALVGILAIPAVSLLAFLAGYYGWSGVVARVEQLRKAKPYAPKYDPDKPYG